MSMRMLASAVMPAMAQPTWSPIWGGGREKRRIRRDDGAIEEGGAAAACGGDGADLVHFFAGGDLEQLAGDLLLHAQQNPIRCQNTNANTSVADGFNSILHLVKAPLWRESGGPRVVAPRLRSVSENALRPAKKGRRWGAPLFDLSQMCPARWTAFERSRWRLAPLGHTGNPNLPTHHPHRRSALHGDESLDAAACCCCCCCACGGEKNGQPSVCVCGGGSHVTGAPRGRKAMAVCVCVMLLGSVHDDAADSVCGVTHTLSLF